MKNNRVDKNTVQLPVVQCTTMAWFKSLQKCLLALLYKANSKFRLLYNKTYRNGLVQNLLKLDHVFYKKTNIKTKSILFSDIIL